MSRRTKGQGISAEYVILIVLVSLAIAVMTVYVRRLVQARFRDANRMAYMKASAVLNVAVQPEYEPYYVNTTADVDAEQMETKMIGANGGQDKRSQLNRTVNSRSIQLPY